MTSHAGFDTYRGGFPWGDLDLLLGLGAGDWCDRSLRGDIDLDLDNDLVICLRGGVLLTGRPCTLWALVKEAGPSFILL